MTMETGDPPAAARRPEFLRFFALQFLAYFVSCWNLRVIAQAHYGSIVLSDFVVAAVNFSLIREVAKAETLMARAGFVAGGALGSVLATWLTQRLYGA